MTGDMWAQMHYISLLLMIFVNVGAGLRASLLAESEAALRQAQRLLNAQAVNANPDAELRALLDIRKYVDRNGVMKQWNAESGSKQKYCSWKGVVCSAAGGKQYVQKIWIAPETGYTGLKGVLPPGIAFIPGLPGLTGLSIHGHPGISGTLPADYSAKNQLQELCLSNNSITGTLPAWQNWTSLTVLELQSNNLTGQLKEEWGRSLTNLMEFDASDNALSGTLPASFVGMTSIRLLYLHTNKFTGSIPDSWGTSLILLSNLALNGNGLTGPLPLSLGLATRLKLLYLNENKLSGSFPSQWGELAALQTFDAGDNQLEGTLPASVANWTRAHVVHIHGNKLTGSLPDVFKYLTSVQDLRLGGNLFTGSVPASWGKLTNLQVLHLHDCKLGGKLPEAWAAMGKLVDLDMADNLFEGSIPASWGTGMKNLRSLSLENNPKLSGCVPFSPKQLPNAQQFVFPKTQVTRFC